MLWYSLEVPQWDTSNEYQQQMFLWRNKKNIYVATSLREIFPTDAGQLSNRLKFLAGQNKFLQDRRLVCYQITISFCQKSQDICQTNWNFLQDRLKICQFCQTVLQFSRRLGYSSYIPMITVFDGSHNYYSSIQYILSEHFLLKGTGYKLQER